MEPDETLRGARIKITLERFWVARYPGRGRHKILCEFTGKSQIQGEAEELRYALSTEANDGASAAVVGAPIFVGASVGNNGISFEGRTINVSNSVDDGVLAALNSGAFKQGLSLLTTAQPALKPFVGLASSIVSAVASRDRNKQVYDFKLGLDFEMSRHQRRCGRDRSSSFKVTRRTGRGLKSSGTPARSSWSANSMVRQYDTII